MRYFGLRKTGAVFYPVMPVYDIFLTFIGRSPYQTNINNAMHLPRPALRFLLLTVLLLLLPSQARTQPDNRHKLDSLRGAIADTEGIDKLKSYMRLADMYATSVNDDLKTDTLFTIYDAMDAEALRQGNVGYRALSRVNKLGHLYNRRKYDRVIELAPEYLGFIDGLESWKPYYMAGNIIVTAHLSAGDFDGAVRTAGNLYEHAEKRQDKDGMGVALLTMAKAYQTQGRSEEAEKYLKQSTGLLSGTQNMLNELTSAWYNLCQTLITLERYDEALEAAAELEKASHRYETSVGTAIPSLWGNLWRIYVRLYIQTGDYDKAELYCEKLEPYMASPASRLTVYKARAQILNARYQHAEALEMIDRAMAITGDGINEEANSVRGIKIMVLTNMGRTEEAYGLFEKAAAINDSIRNVEFAEQIDRLTTEYEVDRHVAEKERQRLIAFWAITGCLLLALLAVIFIVYSRKLRKKNLSLYRQINEERRLEKEAEESQAQIPMEQLPRERKLYLELQNLMHSEKLFADPDIDRNKVSEMLGTNRQYLADAVKHETGLTFSAYIGVMRLKYALELLDENPDLTLDAIAVDSGHGSYSSFFRAFTQKYGMTPSEYRRFSTDKTVPSPATGEE